MVLRAIEVLTPAAFIGLVAISLVAVVPGHAEAAMGDYASWQALDGTELFREGTSVRLCASEDPTTAATITPPSASPLTLSADSEGCWSFILSQDGAWTATWNVTGPETRTIQFDVYPGNTRSWEDWALGAFVFGLVAFGALAGYLWIFSSGILGIGWLIVPAFPLTFEYALVFATIGLGLELLANHFRPQGE